MIKPAFAATWPRASSPLFPWPASCRIDISISFWPAAPLRGFFAGLSGLAGRGFLAHAPPQHAALHM